LSKYPKIVFLDQNKWIDLAHAFADKKQDCKLLALGFRLVEAVVAGKVLFPLTSNLLIETYRMKNFERRSQLAEIQAKFSQGFVFRNRDERIRHELIKFIRRQELGPAPQFPHFWWLSKNFIEAFASWEHLSDLELVAADQLDGIVADPKFALFHWLSTTPASEREFAMFEHNKSSDDLIEKISSRLLLVHGQSFSLRKKIYSAQLALDDSSRIIEVSEKAGVSWLLPGQVDRLKLIKLMQEVPTYACEIELAVRIESLNRPINRNDLRDMSAYTAALPYADVIVGEKLFVNVAKQAGLAQKFGCVLETDIHQLDKFL
jgi:hypothetical protein